MNSPNHDGQTALASVSVHGTVGEKVHRVDVRPLQAIFWAGTACGLLDITAAFITWGVQGVSPSRLLQAIASGWLGAEAFQGGWQASLLGAFFHFFIAFSAATVFYVASRTMRFLTQHAILSGVAYGVAVYLVMNFVVIPLSCLHAAPFSPARALLAIATHMVCVGLPIALVVKRFSK
jgi:hypothetical protein